MDLAMRAVRALFNLADAHVHVPAIGLGGIFTVQINPDQGAATKRADEGIAFPLWEHAA